MTERDRVQLLLWRAGLGATPAQVDTTAAKGYTTAVDEVVNYPDIPAPDAPTVPDIPRDPDAKADAETRIAFQKARNDAIREGNESLQTWWADRLRTSTTPLQENLTLFWHNHFATGVDKVRYPALMRGQNQTLREKGAGKFVDLLIAVSRDPAMLIYLDGKDSVKARPNENWAREVMELFTVGIGNYSEDDIREAARACTGWTLDPFTGEVKFTPNRFDNTPKTVFGQTGNFTMDDISRMLVARPETARYVTRKLFAWFVADDPTEAELAPLLTAWNESGGEIRAVLRAMFLSPAFVPERATVMHVKHPVAWMMGALRGLEVEIEGMRVAQLLTQQGMTLFYPPNVGGWPQGMRWISPSGQVLRYNIAGTVVQRAAMLGGAADAEFVAAVADRLGGIAVPDDLRDRLLDFGKTGDGKRAVVQVLLAAAGYQTR